MGGPEKRFVARFAVAVTPEMLARLRVEAARREITVAALIREYVRKGIDDDERRA